MDTVEEKVRRALKKLPRMGPMTIATGEQLLSQPGLEEQLTTGGNPGRRRIAELLTKAARRRVKGPKVRVGSVTPNYE